MSLVSGGANFLFTELCIEEDMVTKCYKPPFLVNQYVALSRDADIELEDIGIDIC